MRVTRWLIGVLICFLTAVAPRQMAAQTDGRDKAEDFVKDVLGSVFGPNWNLAVHGGYSSHGRFLLQRVATPTGDHERALSTSGGFNIGGGVGLDFLPLVGARLNYTYSTADLSFRDDNGDGSTLLDVDAVGQIESHVVTGELMRYMFPFAFGNHAVRRDWPCGMWWILDQNSDLVAPAGGSTQFRFGGLVAIGLQVKLSSRLDLRAEASTASLHNPFSGNESYTAHGGVTIDEPTRVNKRDYRLVFMYNFSKPELKLPSTNGNTGRN